MIKLKTLDMRFIRYDIDGYIVDIFHNEGKNIGFEKWINIVCNFEKFFISVKDIFEQL